MRRQGLVVKRKKPFVLTAESRHGLPVTEHPLHRVCSPNERERVWTKETIYTGILRD